MKKLYFLLFTLLITVSSTFGQIVINEIDADTPGTDIAEFIELKGTANAPLDGYVVVLYNGNGDTSYAAFDLDGKTLDANGFFILGNTGIISGSDIDLGASNALQNGADAVAIYTGNDTDFPNGTAVTNTNLVDAIVYGTGDPDDAELLAGLGETVQYDESANGASDSESLQLNMAGDAYETKAPTFRDENDAAVCELSLTTTNATCDAFTPGTDSYTATVNFAGGATASYTVMSSSGTVAGDDPNSVANGTIIVTGVSEGTDVTVTVTGAGGLCDLMSTVTSPTCEPALTLPHYEPFDYTNGQDLIASNDWANISDSFDEVTVIMGNLSYAGLPTSTGNMVAFDGGGSDPGLSFTPVTSGDIYASFIFSVTDQSLITDTTDGGYFAFLGNFDTRLWVRPNPDAASSTFDIGFGHLSSSPPFSPLTYNTGTDIFVVMSYNINTTDYNLWINPNPSDFGGSAPAVTMTGMDPGAPTEIGQFVIRQDSTGETPFMLLDELRLGTSWADVTTNTLSTIDFELSNIRLYPNPTSSGSVTISGVNAAPYQVTVYNVLGKQVKQAEVTNTLDVSGLKAGVYILNIAQDGVTTTKKLVIK